MHCVGGKVSFCFCRQTSGNSLADIPAAGTEELRDALQQVNAELAEANTELHDLREVSPCEMGPEAHAQHKHHLLSPAHFGLCSCRLVF